MGRRDDVVDREAILARRAWFVSTALAALSCGPSSGATKAPDATTADADPEADADPAPEDGAPAAADEPRLGGDPKRDAPIAEPERVPVAGPWLQQLPTWAAVAAAAPPRDVPPGLPKADTEPLTRQAAELALLYHRLQTLWTTVPTVCALDRSECRGVWAEFMGAIAELEASVRGLQPLCGFSSRARTTVVQRVDAHHRYLSRRIGELHDAVIHDHEDRDPEATPVLSLLLRERVVAMPCLSCAAPMGISVHGLAVPFETMSAELSPLANDAVLLLAEQLRQFPEVALEVRGHGDPAEGGAAESLAQARAQAVIDRLVDEGVARSRLQLRAFGNRVGVAPSDPAAGGPTNERVDFEVLR